MRVIWIISASTAILAVSGCAKSPPPATPSLTTKTVSGEVISPGGRPIAGASVVVDTDFSGEDFVKLQTDSEGKFAFDLDVPTCGPHRHGTFGRVSVYASGYGVGGGILRERPNVIRLSKAAEIAGSVVDEFGGPVPDARVALNHAEGGTACVRLADPRFVCVQIPVPIGGRGAAQGVLMARLGGFIAGRVIFEDGTPAPDATVLAQPQDDARADAVFDSRAQTDADGSYVLAGLGRGTYNVMVIRPPDGWVAAAQEAVQVAPPHKTPAPDLMLTRGAVVQGRVSDGRTGAPLPGVRVGGHGPIRPESSAAIFAANTDADGRYALRLPPGESYLSAGTGQPPLESPRQSVSLQYGETRTVDLVLWPPRDQSGSWWPF
jgi:hypothetical protein